MVLLWFAVSLVSYRLAFGLTPTQTISTVFEKFVTDRNLNIQQTYLWLADTYIVSVYSSSDT